MEPTLMEKMRQLKRLEELDLITPACEWGAGFDWQLEERGNTRAVKARKIYQELLTECGEFEAKYC